MYLDEWKKMIRLLFWFQTNFYRKDYDSFKQVKQSLLFVHFILFSPSQANRAGDTVTSGGLLGK